MWTEFLPPTLHVRCMSEDGIKRLAESCDGMLGTSNLKLSSRVQVSRPPVGFRSFYDGVLGIAGKRRHFQTVVGVFGLEGKQGRTPDSAAL